MPDSRTESFFEIICCPQGKIVRARPGQTVLEALLACDTPIEHSCGGNGTCGTCRIFIEKKLENLQPRNEIESEIAKDRSFTENERLSCQTLAIPGLELIVPNL